jgi:DNA-binding MarR family transcriptional regulator
MSAPIQHALDFVQARRAAGLSDETMAVLLCLSQHGALNKEAIARHTRINPTTLPRYLATLLESGHLQKQAAEADRREKLFRLAEHGKRLVESLLNHFPQHG